jgi:hypothetical protein
MRGIEETRETLTQRKDSPIAPIPSRIKLSLTSKSHIFTDLSCQFLHFLVWNIKKSIFNLEGFQLLVLKRHTNRQRSNMPMDVTVPLLAAQRQDVNPFGIDGFAHRFGRLIDSPLQSKIFFERKIACHVLLMLNGSDQRVSVENRIFVEKQDELIILLNNVIALQAACDHLTDKAWTVLNPIYVGIKIEGLSLIHGQVHFS